MEAASAACPWPKLRYQTGLRLDHADSAERAVVRAASGVTLVTFELHLRCIPLGAWSACCSGSRARAPPRWQLRPCEPGQRVIELDWKPSPDADVRSAWRHQPQGINRRDSATHKGTTRRPAPRTPPRCAWPLPGPPMACRGVAGLGHPPGAGIMKVPRTVHRELPQTRQRTGPTVRRSRRCRSAPAERVRE